MQDHILDLVRETMQWSYEMFLARDEMNAKVHCAPLRLSPITERVKYAIEVFDEEMRRLEPKADRDE